MINQPEVAATIAALHEEYEAALVSNDVEKLVGFFWDSEHALRFGVAESLYGAKEIEEFRKKRPPADLQRKVFNAKIVTFGGDTAVVTIEFIRHIQGSPRHGRQTQVWRNFEAGWKIVSAHISFVPPSYMDQASALVGMPIPAGNREAVRANLERVAVIARPLFDFPIDDSVESAPVFVP
ncbi:MAG: oxalurate catabolism protein HpxZ [Acidobacteria bacterium]|nr:oxalurate catabolism protein HpxZ [Acidobacteriota bacterium]MBI3472911.1 oxalurate catabolism protein HpxZ [Candidatus Solibacter usitatus]